MSEISQNSALGVNILREPAAASDAIAEFTARCRVPNLFLCREWLRAWWETYQKNKHLHILVFSKGRENVGIAPLYVNQNYSGIRAYRFLGDGKANYLDIICCEGFERHVANTLLDSLSGDGQPAILDFNDVRSDSIFFTHLETSLSERQIRCSKYPLYPCPFGRLGPNWHSIFGNSIQRSKYRSEFKRKIGKSEQVLSTIGKLEFKIVDNIATWTRVFPQLVEVHSHRFSGTTNRVLKGKGGDFIYRLGKNLLGRGMVVSLLTLDEEPISFIIGFIMGNAFVHYIPAFDPAFKKSSIGHLHLKYFSEWLIKEGVGIMDLSKGDHAYKQKWTTEVFWNYRYFIHLNPTAVSRVHYLLRKKQIEAILWGRERGYNSQIKKLVAAVECLFSPNGMQRQKTLRIRSQTEETSVFHETNFSYRELKKIPWAYRAPLVDYYLSHPRDDLRLYVDGAKIVLKNRTKNEFCML